MKRVYHHFLLALITMSVFLSCSNEAPPIVFQEEEYKIQDGDFEALFENQHEYGINFTIMGEGYTREDIESGLYKEALSKDIDDLFKIYPLSAYKQHFNVYLIYAISKDEGVSVEGGEDKDTALSVWFDPTKRPPQSSFRWDARKVRRYAKTDTLITKYNHLSFVSMKNPDGPPMGGVATLSLALQGQALYETGAVGIMIHEFGHAFAALGDEYWVQDQEQFTDSIIDIYKARTAFFVNIDTVPEYDSVKWHKYQSIPGYEEVGTFEGAQYLEEKMWRPEFVSIMQGGGDGFNAPSREAIVFRIAQLARFHFDFDEFIRRDRVEKDFFNRAVSMGPISSCRGFFPESAILEKVD